MPLFLVFRRKLHKCRRAGEREEGKGSEQEVLQANKGGKERGKEANGAKWGRWSFLKGCKEPISFLPGFGKNRPATLHQGTGGWHAPGPQGDAARAFRRQGLWQWRCPCGDRRQTRASVLMPRCPAAAPAPLCSGPASWGASCQRLLENMFIVGNWTLFSFKTEPCALSHLLRTYSNDKGEGSWPWGGECAPG